MMRVKKIFKGKKTVIDICLTVLFFFGILFYVYKKDLKTDVRMLVELKVQNQETFELKVDDLTLKARVIPDEDFKTIIFKLPKKDVRKIHFFLGKKPGRVIINRITLKTLWTKYQWQGLRINKLFNFGYHISRTFVSGDKFIIEPGMGTPSLNMVAVFSDIINKIGRGKIVYYFLAVFLALLFFYFIHHIDLRGLKLFFNRRILINMVLIFLILIFSPFINDLFRLIKPFPLTEKRTLARYSEFRFDSLFDYLHQYSNYFNDHFSLRSYLVYMNNLIHFKLFKKSTVPMVIIGKDGWLFMGKETENRDEQVYFRRLLPFTKEELEHWKQILLQRQKWLAARGIHYLLVVVPNKSTIYPEFMPHHLRRLPHPSRLDQLLQYIGKSTGIKILDLRIPLLVAKKNQLVYSRTDSHWNQFGIYVSYLHIMDYLMSIFPGEKSLPLSEFDIVRRNWAGGDLAAALSLQMGILREERVWLKPKSPPDIKKIPLKNISPYVRQSLSQCETARFPPAIFVHDSFAIELRPFISRHFSQIRYVWDWELNIYPDLIRKDQVKIVIEEMGERYLLDKILTNPEEIGD